MAVGSVSFGGSASGPVLARDGTALSRTRAAVSCAFDFIRSAVVLASAIAVSGCGGPILRIWSLPTSTRIATMRKSTRVTMRSASHSGRTSASATAMVVSANPMA